MKTITQIGAPFDVSCGALLCANPRHMPPPADLFGREGPLEVEIGCGKGKLLIARAAENPDIDFLGVDVAWKWMKYAVERSEKRRLANIKFMKSDARELVRYGLPARSVSVFHVYFPDPWPKRRHAKRRLITGEFLRLIHSRLETGGLVEMATDFEDYFLQMRVAVVHSGVPWRRVRRAENSRLFATTFKTNYELKYATVGRNLYYLELEK